MPQPLADAQGKGNQEMEKLLRENGGQILVRFNWKIKSFISLKEENEMYTSITSVSNFGLLVM